MSNENSEAKVLWLEIAKWYIIVILGTQSLLLAFVLKKLVPIFDQYVFPNIEKQELTALFLLELLIIALLAVACLYLYRMAVKKQRVEYISRQDHII